MYDEMVKISVHSKKYGCLAVHRSINKSHGKWTISHVGTGFSLGAAIPMSVQNDENEIHRIAETLVKEIPDLDDLLHRAYDGADRLERAVTGRRIQAVIADRQTSDKGTNENG